MICLLLLTNKKIEVIQDVVYMLTYSTARPVPNAILTLVFQVSGLL